MGGVSYERKLEIAVARANIVKLKEQLKKLKADKMEPAKKAMRELELKAELAEQRKIVSKRKKKKNDGGWF